MVYKCTVRHASETRRPGYRNNWKKKTNFRNYYITEDTSKDKYRRLPNKSIRDTYNVTDINCLDSGKKKGLE